MLHSRILSQVFLYAKLILPVLALFVGIYFLARVSTLFFLLVLFVAWVFVLFCILYIVIIILDIIARRRHYAKQFLKDLQFARQILIVAWFIVTLLRLFLLFLQVFGRLKVHINGKIPKGKWIAAGNHPDLMLRDVFVVPIIIFFLKLKYFLDPLVWFPRTIAEVRNFLDAWFFRIIRDVADVAIIGVYRDNDKDNEAESDSKNGRRKRFLKNTRFFRRFKKSDAGIQIINIEAGRTTTALNAGQFETRIVGQNVLVMGSPTRGVARLSKFNNAPVVPYYIRMKGGELESRIKVFLATREQYSKVNPFFINPKASPNLGWRGWIHLLNPWGAGMELEIGLPAGPLISEEKETEEEFTERIYESIFKAGKLQLWRSRKPNKLRVVRLARIYVRKMAKIL